MQKQINIAYILLITSSIHFDAFLHRRKYDTAILFILKKIISIGIIFRNRVTQPRLATKLDASGKKMAANNMRVTIIELIIRQIVSLLPSFITSYSCGTDYETFS